MLTLTPAVSSVSHRVVTPPQIMTTDFRAEAAEATRRLLDRAPESTLSDLGESGCVAVPGGQRAHYRMEVPALIISTICLVCAVLALPLTWLDVLPKHLFLPVLGGGLLVSLVHRKIKSLLLQAYLSSRAGNLLTSHPDLPRKSVGLEDARTHKKIKLIIEDEGLCLLDSERRRLLIEGCSYRCIICAKDVRSIGPMSGYALSGARVNCRMAGCDIEFVLTVSGQGPVASLLQAFSPSAAATGLATVLNRTLFGADTPSFIQAALPPSLPGTRA